MGTISIHIATECKVGIPKRAKRGGFIILVVLLQALLAAD